jgi:Domain of unknown function (DUF1844)
MSDEEKKPFEVKDRRHFTPEGEARQDAPEVPIAEPELEPKAAAPSDEEPSPHEPDLVGLLLSLAAQASALLGMGEGEEDEQGGPPHVDLAGARGLIGLLEVLERKTKGNRTPEEDQVLTGILYELRMAYLARAR